MLAGMILLTSGCAHQVFIPEADLDHYRKHMPVALAESNPTLGLPPKGVLQAQAPVTVTNPEREPWYLSLQEAIAITLEQGTTGIQSVSQPGNVANDLLTFAQLQGLELQSDDHRVLAMNPAIRGAALEASLGRFDAKWVTSLGWNYTDQQVQGLGSFQNGSSALFSSTLVKPLATGGVTGITFSSQYTDLATPPTGFQIQNPAYLSRVDLVFEHPLLQNFGTDINQLLRAHPGVNTGSQLPGAAQNFVNGHINSLAGSGFSNVSGILITRLQFDQSRAEYERALNYRLLNVEAAYWNLYGAYVTLYAAESGLKLARESWSVAKNLKDAGAEGKEQGAEANPLIAEPQARAQYEEFRANRFLALGQVLEAERVLRRLLGLESDDGKQLIPIDTPTVAPFVPDYQTARYETIHLRPELVAARQELKFRQLELLTAKNDLKLDLNFTSRYGINGLGSRLDGDGEIFDQANAVFRADNSLRNLSSTDFTDWNIGLTLNMPIGYRVEHAFIRRARLRLVQADLALKNEENKAISFLDRAYRDLIDKHKTIQAQRARRIGSAEELRVREQLIKGGQGIPNPFLLDAQRRFATALNAEYQAIVQYNTALAVFQFAKGTIMQHNNVVINEGPLPHCAQVRAVEHERERSKALLIRERENPVQHQNVTLGNREVLLPVLSPHQAVSLPALYQGTNSGPNMPVPELQQDIPGKINTGSSTTAAPINSLPTVGTTTQPSLPPQTQKLFAPNTPTVLESYPGAKSFSTEISR